MEHNVREDSPDLRQGFGGIPDIGNILLVANGFLGQA